MAALTIIATIPRRKDGRGGEGGKKNFVTKIQAGACLLFRAYVYFLKTVFCLTTESWLLKKKKAPHSTHTFPNPALKRHVCLERELSPPC